MKSAYTESKTSRDILYALAEIMIALSELTATRASEELKFSEVGRDGMANLFAMLEQELLRGLARQEEEGRRE